MSLIGGNICSDVTVESSKLTCKTPPGTYASVVVSRQGESSLLYTSMLQYANPPPHSSGNVLTISIYLMIAIIVML